MTTEVVFEEPPALKTRPGPGRRPNPVWEACRQRPGEWAVYSVDYATNSLGRSLPRGFESTSRKNRDRSFKVWVRYVGEAGA